MANRRSSYVAECFWPDVDEDAVRDLDERIAASLGESVRYLGSILIRDDEVVLCLFEGTAEAIREVAERAHIPYERVLAMRVTAPTEQRNVDA